MILLYITANPKNITQSRGLTAGEAFLKEYAAHHPGDEVVRLNLFSLDVPNLDQAMIAALSGQEPAEETPRKKLTQLRAYADQFVKADRYVFVTPLWNLGVPPALKTYLDNVSQAGQTFRYTENGPEGLLKGKKSLHIHACGGIYSAPEMAPLDHGAAHLRDLMGLFGVADHTLVRLEGLDMFPQEAGRIADAAAAELRALAPVFGRESVVPVG